MQTRWLGILTAVLAAVPGVALAVDAPHDASFSDGDCDRCHMLADVSSSGKLNSSKGCVACHNGDAVPRTTFGFPWLSDDQAKPGVNGNSHSWSGFAQSATYGAKLPSSGTAVDMLVDGKLQCATCHEPHHADGGSEPDAVHVSIALSPVTHLATVGTGSATMTLLNPGTLAKGYRLQVVDNGGGAKGFVISHDFGLATGRTWFKYSGGSWQPGSLAGPGYPITTGAANVPLDDSSVRVTFTSGAAVGDYWDFYVSYPFLRIGAVHDAICLDCHSERAMDHLTVRGVKTNMLPNGVRLFSHPVGVAMNANGMGYDRPVIRDAHGLSQSPGDSDESNDLVLDGGIVRCTTCHAVHNADSNSLTPDKR